MVEQIVLDDDLASRDVHEDRVGLHSLEERRVDEAPRLPREGQREDDEIRSGEQAAYRIRRRDLVGRGIVRRRPGRPDRVHPEGLGEARDLPPDAPQAEDQDRGTGEGLVDHALVEGSAADLLRSRDDVLRGRQEKGHRVLRDGRGVGSRVAADDRGPREPVERQVVDAREEGLDHPETGRPRRQVLRQFRAEARADEDFRGGPCRVPLGRRQVREDDWLESGRRLGGQDRAALRVDRHRQ